MAEPWTEADDFVEEDREIRRRLSAEFDDDPVRIAEFYMESQKQFADRLVNYDKADRNGKSAA